MSLQIRAYDFAADALFLDFDGTLVDLASHPENVVLSPALIPMLERLQQAAGGALAVVTGRPLAQIDRFLAPLRLPAAGVHGLERRDAQGCVTHLDAPDTGALMKVMAPLAARHTELLLEQKRGALALHYRQAPHLEQVCLEIIQRAVMHMPGFAVLRGKMVVEVKADVADKGDAIAAFMREAPFAGRRPVFAGDDVTDEAGFAWVQSAGLDGIGVKIGDGASQALMRLDNPAQLHRWLAHALPATPAATP